MYVLNEYMEFGVDTPHIATYNFKLVFLLLFLTIYSKAEAIRNRPPYVSENPAQRQAQQHPQFVTSLYFKTKDVRKDVVLQFYGFFFSNFRLKTFIYRE